MSLVLGLDGTFLSTGEFTFSLILQRPTCKGHATIERANNILGGVNIIANTTLDQSRPEKFHTDNESKSYVRGPCQTD
jgi:hypothetical protein